MKDLLVKHNFDENIMIKHSDYNHLLAKEKAQLESFIWHEPVFIKAKEYMIVKSIKYYNDLLLIPEFSQLKNYQRFKKCVIDQKHYKNVKSVAPSKISQGGKSKSDHQGDDANIESLLKSSSPQKKQKIIFDEPMPTLNLKNEEAQELMIKEVQIMRWEN